MQIKTRSCFPVLFLLLAFSLSNTVLADQQTVSVGYGLGMLNNTRQAGHLWDNHYYDFGQIVYGYERTLSRKFNLLLEPYISVVNRPDNGLDLGLTINGRYYLGQTNHRGLFATVGGGGAYTSIKFEEQGTHGLFILHGGLGHQGERILVEARFRHYSNGGFAHPNRSVDATIVSVGYVF
jgi:hypothetical protein